MMAHWDLQALANELARLRVPLDLVVGSRDRTVPPSQAERVLARLPAKLHSTLTRLQGLGHLAHEEEPEQVARLIVERFVRRQ
jgi:magnesium chelatase accessory protein